MTGRDFPRPWLERRHTTGRRLALLVAFLFLIVAVVLMITDPLANRIEDKGVELGPFPTGDGDRVEVAP